MMRRLLLIGLAAAGTTLFLLGVSWDRFRPPESYWSQNQAQQYVDAFAAVHAAEDSYGADSARADDLVAAGLRYEQVKNELDQARAARDRGGKIVIVAGLLVMLATIALRHYWPPPARKDRSLKPLVLTSQDAAERR